MFLALQARGTELTGARYVLERLSLGDRAVRLGREAGRPEYAAWGHLWRLGALAELGRRVPYDAELAAFAVAVDQLREPLWTWRLTLVRTSVALCEGRLDRAAELMAEGQERGRRAGHEAADFFHLIHAEALAQLTGVSSITVSTSSKSTICVNSPKWPGAYIPPAASTVRVMTDFSCNGTPDDLLARHKLIYQDVPLRHSPGLDLRLNTQTQRC